MIEFLFDTPPFKCLQGSSDISVRKYLILLTIKSVYQYGRHCLQLQCIMQRPTWFFTSSILQWGRLFLKLTSLQIILKWKSISNFNDNLQLEWKLVLFDIIHWILNNIDSNYFKFILFFCFVFLNSFMILWCIITIMNFYNLMFN